MQRDLAFRLGMPGRFPAWHDGQPSDSPRRKEALPGVAPLCLVAIAHFDGQPSRTAVLAGSRISFLCRHHLFEFTQEGGNLLSLRRWDVKVKARTPWRRRVERRLIRFLKAEIVGAQKRLERRRVSAIELDLDLAVLHAGILYAYFMLSRRKKNRRDHPRRISWLGEGGLKIVGGIAACKFCVNSAVYDGRISKLRSFTLTSLALTELAS